MFDGLPFIRQGIKIWKYICMFPIRDIIIELDQLIIIYVYVTMLFWLNFLGRVSTAVHSTQVNEAHPDTFSEGLETGTPLTTRTTRNRLRKGMASNSRIRFAKGTIVLSWCLFVIKSLIYGGLTYQSKRISIILLKLIQFIFKKWTWLNLCFASILFDEDNVFLSKSKCTWIWMYLKARIFS